MNGHSSVFSGGLNIEIHGKWFDSVTNHGIMISVGDAHFSSVSLKIYIPIKQCSFCLRLLLYILCIFSNLNGRRIFA